ncbi:MAG TPA: hypothetical protein VHW69_05275 [Rhizomicrobium sp.]|jgi:hypothetical protein|nr:hypothetical protein [Rhizomicrobium sp.]
MRPLGTKLGLQIALLLPLFVAAVPSRAQSTDSAVHLHVCNKGTVPVEVIAAQKNEPLLGNLYWDVDGTTVSPGQCKHVYGTTAGYPAYIGFGLTDATGRWGAGKIVRVPDLGTFVRWFHSQKILTGAAVPLCAQRDTTSYRTDGDLPANCTGLKYMTDFSGHLIAPDARYGPLLPLNSALYLETTGQSCTEGGSPSPCNLYLNISPSVADRELHAAAGTNNGAEDAKVDSGDSVGTQLLKLLAESAAEERRKQAQRQAQVANAAPSGGFVRFQDGCNAFYRDPANARLSMSDATGWCACLSEQYRSLMTPVEEAKYANDYGRLFHAGIAQPWGYGTSKSDPAWARLHPAVDRCAR